MIMSYVGTNKRLQDAYLGGEVALELSPQGTIAERLRAGGAGMPGIFTRTGAGESRSTPPHPTPPDLCMPCSPSHSSQSCLLPVWTDHLGTLVETGGIPQKYSRKNSRGEQTIEIEGAKKEVYEFEGKRYLMEPAIKGDVGIVRAWKVDKAGNCVFR